MNGHAPLAVRAQAEPRRADPTTRTRIRPSTRCCGVGTRICRRSRRTSSPCRCTSSCVVEPGPAGDGLGESGPSRPPPAGRRVSRVVLDRAHDRPSGRRPRAATGPAAPQGRRLRAAARGHGRAPRAVEGRGLHVLPASPELHAGEGGRRPAPPGHLSRLRQLRLGARVSPDAPAPRRPLRPRPHAEGAAGAHVSAAVSGAVRDSVESRARRASGSGKGRARSVGRFTRSVGISTTPR